ncbi:MAG: hypothetical protein NTW75_17490 [Planctomycetales bacterium]|jgi:hypothetical protein|nr:hypothetical protein [Planctomycetales bacterium]
MIEDFEHEQLRRQPHLRAALKVYGDLQDHGRDRSPDFDGWIPRVVEVAEIESSALPSIHGKLIAFGFLTFDLAGRDTGMRYQLTPLGKNALTGKTLSEEQTLDID